MSTLSRIDLLCDEFEALGRSGGRPKIQEFLKRAQESERARLLRELVALDVDVRRKAGDPVRESDYHHLGPDAVSQARAVLEEFRFMLTPPGQIGGSTAEFVDDQDPVD